MKKRYLTLCLLVASFSVQAAITLKSQITGLDGELLKNARERLETSQALTHRKLTPELIQQLQKQAPSQIRKALEPFGYFKPIIKTHLSHQNDEWLATYTIQKGPRLRITQLNIIATGKGKNQLAPFIQKISIKPGDGFDSTKYDKMKTYLLNTAQKYGFLQAKFTQDQLRINIPRYTCHIKIIIDTGPLFYFGNIDFDKTPLNDTFLKRFLNITPNQPFSYAKLIELQQNLNGSTYFQEVSVIPEHQKTKNDHVPIHVNLKMKKRKAYLFGAGYGTNTGIRGTLGFNQRWLNRLGHKLSATLKLSQIENSLDAQYLIPGKNSIHDQTAINAGFVKQTPKHGESLTAKLGIARITNYTLWQRILGLNFQLERYRAAKNDPFQGSRLLLPNIALSRIYADSNIHVTNGSRFHINFDGASTHALSTVTFLQIQLQYKGIATFLRDNRFIVRADAGYTAVHDLSKLPLTQRFYAGGIGSVRGYALKSLGPGRYLAIASAEYQRRIYGNWYIAAFYDIGNAIDHINEPLRRGTGGGIVWQSPIGALQLYVSRALSREGNPTSVEISIGPDL